MKRLFPSIAAISLVATLFLTGQGCTSSSQEVPIEAVNLEIWGVFDNEDAFEQIIKSYQAIHPNVTITYTEKRYSEYEDDLIRALAENRGPDILAVHNTKIREWQDLIQPMPESVTVTKYESAGGLGNSVVNVLSENTMPTQREIQDNFVAQVAEDVILPYSADPALPSENRIFGLPLSMDSLALYYNQDLLDAAGIAQAPSTWEAFQEAVKALTVYDDNGDIIRSGAAIGTANNVERSSDILALLMMQNGTQMVDDRDRIAFHLIPSGMDSDVSPGLLATEFYTAFANPIKEVYTWNDTFDSSFEAFANGETAMFFGYSYHWPLLKTVAPKLNLKIAKMPQIDPSVQEVNLANYWIEAVSAQTPEADWAWDFLSYMADSEQVPYYLNETQKASALRSLIPEQSTFEHVGVFAKQALTAKFWYKGTDVETTEKAFHELISGILALPEDPANLITTIAKKVSQTL